MVQYYAGLLLSSSLVGIEHQGLEHLCVGNVATGEMKPTIADPSSSRSHVLPKNLLEIDTTSQEDTRWVK